MSKNICLILKLQIQIIHKYPRKKVVFIEQHHSTIIQAKNIKELTCKIQRITILYVDDVEDLLL